MIAVFPRKRALPAPAAVGGDRAVLADAPMSITGKDVDLECRCGEVHGRVHNVSPRNVNRILCYCDDCQAFLHHLGRPELLDDEGGTRLIQVPPASVSFDRGADRVRAVRLGPKGLYRWYASCCNTPVGNTLGPSIPFIGIGESLFRFGAATAEIVGGPPVPVFGKYAIGEPPAGATKLDLRLAGRTIRLILRWKLTKQTWPHPFFDRESREPLHAVTVLTPAEREALRAFCGPKPTRTPPRPEKEEKDGAGITPT
jgi:uncharacterized protein DUF6151